MNLFGETTWSGSLPDSKTHKGRSYSFCLTPESVSDAIVVISQGGKSCERYELQEIADGEYNLRLWPGERAFMLAREMLQCEVERVKLTDETEPGFYVVRIPAEQNIRGSCTCIGGRRVGHCKHVSTMFHVVHRHGWINPRKPRTRRLPP